MCQISAFLTASDTLCLNMTHQVATFIDGMRTATALRLCSDLSEVSESNMNDWWLATLILVPFITAVALLVYLGLEWAAGM
jgi:hypothetical protein